MGLMVSQHAVNIPVADDWERVELLRRYYAGELELSYLLAPHIEHRMFFPRLITLALNGLSGGDLRWEMWFTFGIMLGYSLLLISLVKRTIGRPTWVFGLSFLINLLVFSPIQFQNFLWAIQIAFTLPLLALVWCIWVMVHPKFSLPIKWGLCALGALVATLSFGHGVFVWLVPACLGLLLHGFGKNNKARLAFVGSWVCLAAAAMFLYFTWDFVNVSAPAHAYGQESGQKPPAFEKLVESTEDMEGTRKFFVVLLGNPLARMFIGGVEGGAEFIGWLMILACVAAVATWFWTFRDRERRNSALPWLALIGFGVAATLAIALARSWLGIKGALIPRYASISIPVILGLLGFWAHQLRHWRESVASDKVELNACRTRIAAIAATVIAMIQLPTWLYGLHQMELWEKARLQARVSLMYIKDFPLNKTSRLDVSWSYVKKQAEYLNEKGLLDPPLVEDQSLGPFRTKKSPLSSKKGDLAESQFSEDGKVLTLRGHATLPKCGRCADGVLATIPEGDSWKVIGVLEMEPLANLPPVRMDYQYTARTILDQPEVYGAWNGTISMINVPEGEEITLWAVDAKSMSAHKFKESIRLMTCEEKGKTVEVIALK